MTHKKQTVSGFLLPYFPEGTDRVLWSISATDDSRSMRVLPVEDDDYLTVYEHTGALRWEGQIHFEYQRNSSPKPEFLTRQLAFGRVVHGFQSNCDPEDWALMFFEQLPAKLLKK